MFRLNLLGAVALTDRTARLRNSDVGGTKPLGLLIYLLLEGAQRPVRRDRIVGVLWPESEQEKARQSLSQALYKLRTALGEVVVSNGQEELGIDRTLITSDCFEFDEAVRSGRLEAAVALYGGDVASGLNVKDAPEFDQWLSNQRASWRARYVSVVEKLFNLALQSGELTRAVTWAERLIDAAPENDEPVRTLLPRLIERGQAAAAKCLYGKYQRMLADQFDIAPAPEVSALIENLPPGRRSLRAIRPAIEPSTAPVTRRRGSLTSVVTLVAVLAAIVIGVPWYRSIRSQGWLSALESTSARIAVLPFTYREPAQRSATVLNEALQWRLRSAGFQVLDAGSQDPGAVRKLAAGNTTSGTLFVVGGDVAIEPDRSVVARLWLNEAASGRRVWEARFAQPQADAHLVVTQLSDAVTTQIRLAAGSVAELSSGGEKVSAQSWKDLYHARERMEAAMDMRRQGAVAGSASEIADAEQTLARLSQREPHWALPWVLRGRLTEARAFSALLAGNAPQGALELERGIRMLDSVAPGLDADDVYEMRGLLQYRRYLFGVDEIAAANALLARAESDLRKAFGPARDPSRTYSTLSGVMFAQGKYAEAFVYARRAYDSNVFLRNNEEVLTRLFNSALHAGDDAAADHWCRELQNTLPGNWPAVLCRIHLAGFAPRSVNVAELERDIARVVAAPPIRRMMEPRLKAAYAITLAQLGQTDSARATLASVAGSADPEVTLFSAFALTALEDAPRAHALLRNYLAQYRGTRSTALHMRWLH